VFHLIPFLPFAFLLLLVVSFASFLQGFPRRKIDLPAPRQLLSLQSLSHEGNPPHA
jgi:hypothetical protein